jgi:RimJ/RimL family protein N-acetyltransferase
MKTERLILREFNSNDKEELISLLNDKTVTKWMENIPFPYLEKHANWWIETGSKKKYQYAIINKKSNKLIGSLKITLKGEIGCWIGTDYWKKGFASEAIERIKKFGFNELKLDKLWAATHKDNGAPFELMRNTGFTRIDDKAYYVEGIGNTKIRPHFELTKSP